MSIFEANIYRTIDDEVCIDADADLPNIFILSASFMLEIHTAEGKSKTADKWLADLNEALNPIGVNIGSEDVRIIQLKKEDASQHPNP